MSRSEGRSGGAFGGDEYSQARIGEPLSRDTAARHAAALSLDEAEDIAARRLHELAIRLEAEDPEFADEAPPVRAPFDADRHFRALLARRIATMQQEQAGFDEEDAEADETDPGVEAYPARSYSITDALPLASFGDALRALGAPRGLEQPTGLEPEEAPSSATDFDETGDVDPAAFASEQAPLPGLDGEYHEPVEALEGEATQQTPAMRLVDLINEQRTLLNRLTDLSLSHKMEPAQGVHVALATDGLELAHEALQSDAERLFEAGTHEAEPLQQANAEEEQAAPPAISAEQLIAALEQSASPVEMHETGGDAASDAETPQPAGKEIAAALPDMAAYTVPERAPMIIERAHAELAALASGEAVAAPARPSGAFGFIAGLCLSAVIGVGLYFTM